LGLLAGCGGKDQNTDPNMMMMPAATLQTMTVSFDLTAPAIGETLIATAHGHYSDGTDKDVADVTWTSSNPAVLEAVADMPGHFVAKMEGPAQITGKTGTLMSVGMVTIGPVKVASLDIVPDSGKVGLGGHIKVAVVATYSDQSQKVVTDDVQW